MSPSSAFSTALRLSASASPSSNASTAIVVLLREPLGRPAGLPLLPGSNGRPRGFAAALSAVAKGCWGIYRAALFQCGLYSYITSDDQGRETDRGGLLLEAEARAFECCIVERLNIPRRCLTCGVRDQPGDPLLPCGTADSGHAWLRFVCRPEWHRDRGSKRRRRSQRWVIG
jgi:hypothetical protein